MKKNFFRIFAFAAMAMGMTFVSCQKDNETDGDSGNPVESSTIVYINFENRPLSIERGEHTLSIVDNEFQIQNEGDMAFFAIFKPGAGVVSTQGQYYKNVTPLQENTEIGSSNSFHMYNAAEGYANADLYSYQNTAWSGKTAYIGVCFQKDGATHYGWIKTQCIVNSGNCIFKVFGIAYEGTAGKAIKAGATK